MAGRTRHPCSKNRSKFDVAWIPGQVRDDKRGAWESSRRQPEMTVRVKTDPLTKAGLVIQEIEKTEL